MSESTRTTSRKFARRAAIGITGGVLALTAVAGTAAAASASPADSSGSGNSSAASPSRTGRPAPPDPAVMAKAIAEKLGVDQSKVAAALSSFFAAHHPDGDHPHGAPPTGNPPAHKPPTGKPPTGTPPTGKPPAHGAPDKAHEKELATYLAKKLGISQDKVLAALQAARPAGVPPQA